LPGLYAAGEVSCTGVHGANRLAGTSLLESLVWAARVADHIRHQPGSRAGGEADVPAWSDSGLQDDADPALIQGDLQTVRNLMWHYVGLVRNQRRLDRGIRELRELWINIEEFYRQARLSDGLIGLRNAVQAALIVAWAARGNRTTRGCHYREPDGREPCGGALPARYGIDKFVAFVGVLGGSPHWTTDQISPHEALRRASHWVVWFHVISRDSGDQE
jgi:L-aspartate oxidase